MDAVAQAAGNGNIPTEDDTMLSKFLPNNTKEQQAYKAQRVKTTMLYGGGMDAVALAAGNGNIPTDPIAAALAAHGDGVAHKKKKSINPNNFFNPNSTWR